MKLGRVYQIRPDDRHRKGYAHQEKIARSIYIAHKPDQCEAAVLRRIEGKEQDKQTEPPVTEVEVCHRILSPCESSGKADHDEGR